MVSRRDLDQVPDGNGIRVPCIVEIAQRKRRVQMFDDFGELSRRRVPPLTGHIEMKVVAVQGDVGGNRDGNRGAGDERVHHPSGQARSAAAQRHTDR